MIYGLEPCRLSPWAPRVQPAPERAEKRGGSLLSFFTVDDALELFNQLSDLALTRQPGAVFFAGSLVHPWRFPARGCSEDVASVWEMGAGAAPAQPRAWEELEASPCSICVSALSPSGHILLPRMLGGWWCPHQQQSCSSMSPWEQGGEPGLGLSDLYVKA